MSKRYELALVVMGLLLGYLIGCAISYQTRLEIKKPARDTTVTDSAHKDVR